MFKFSCLKRNKRKYSKNINFDIKYRLLSKKHFSSLSTCFKSNEKSETILSCSNQNISKTENTMKLVPEKNEQSLAEKLFNMTHYGWYWGPLSRVEANVKLKEEPDGTFLVRDSSDNRHILTLSFRSHGQTYHTHINHIGGMFSLQRGQEFSALNDLILDIMKHSFISSFTYTMRDPTYNNNSIMFVKLTRPSSRFNQVRPLQYLCRFVIRQYFRADIIPKLPLPNSIMQYIEAGQY